MIFADFSETFDLSFLSTVPADQWSEGLNETLTWRHIVENPAVSWPMRWKAHFDEFEPLDPLTVEDLSAIAEVCSTKIAIGLADRLDFARLSQKPSIDIDTVLHLVRRRPA
jgi:hypothetical protein